MGIKIKMEDGKFSLKIMYHKFFVFLPALLVIMLILMIYVSYWVSYIIPLLHNWNAHFSKTTLEYPFSLTSTHNNSHQKGLVLGISSGFFVVILMISLLRTIFSNPGYFPNPTDLEYKIVQKNFLAEQEAKLKEKKRLNHFEDNKEEENLDDNFTIDLDTKGNNVSERENFLNLIMEKQKILEKT